MAGFARAVALDLDGTLTQSDDVDERALRAIERVRDEGLAVLLVTGRILAELDDDMPGLVDRFDAVVAENGAVLLIDGETRALADPVEDQLAATLAEADVTVRRGEVLLAGDAADVRQVVEAVGALGLDCQVVRNRAALMVLPSGVSKGTGLVAALAVLGVSPHNTIAVGDAENDLALLHVAEIGVAVGNAVASLREHADLVLDEPDGAGVAALLNGPVRTGERRVRPARRRLPIGHFADSTPATVPGLDANVMVCGDSGAGKSYLAGLLIEAWIAAGYTVLVVDMEGDHTGLQRLHDTVVIDTRPSAAELLTLLRQRGLSVVLDVSTLDPAERLDYLRTLPGLVQAERAAWGLPHWIVVDEAHVPLADGGIIADLFRPTDRGFCLVTYRPQELCAAALEAIDVTITAVPPPLVRADWPAGARRAARIREAGGTEHEFTTGPRRTPHVRHRRKYVIGALPRHRWFTFRRPDGQPVGNAADLAQFSRLLHTVDTDVVAHHLERGDFSRWMMGSLQDRELSGAAGAIEQNLLARRAVDVTHARERLLQEVEARYLTGG